MPFLDLFSPELHYCGRIKDNKYDDYNVNNSIRIRVLMQTNWLRLKMMHQYFVGSNLIWDVQWLRGHEWVVKHASFCPCSGLKMLTKGTFMWFWSVSLADQFLGQPKRNCPVSETGHFFLSTLLNFLSSLFWKLVTL